MYGGFGNGFDTALYEKAKISWKNQYNSGSKG